VITGADRGEIGVMIFPNMSALKAAGYGLDALDGALTDPDLRARLQEKLASLAKDASSSTRISRAIILAEPASMPMGEMTAKGNLNFDAILSRRAALLDRLYDNNDPAVVKL
jgi:feruloyl-CoA synthase